MKAESQFGFVYSIDHHQTASAQRVVFTREPKLTSDIVVRSLAGLGIPSINQALAKHTGTLTFPAPIVRDGPGYRAEVDLPHGVTAADIVERTPAAWAEFAQRNAVLAATLTASR